MRTFHVQVVQSDYYSGRADNQSLMRITRKPDRGRILDRNQKPMVVNAKIIDSTAAKPRNLNRVVLNEKSASQILGYVGRDKQGMMGLEYAFEEELRGLDGWSYRKVDVNRNYYPGMEKGGKEPQAGMDMVLTIDSRIQAILDDALKRGVENCEAKSGTAVVVNPHTGEVLAMGTYPSFNPNDPSTIRQGITRNQYISKTYEPGSTFKLITASAALEENTLSEHDSINGDQGRFQIYGDVITDTHEYGMLSFGDAMAYSSNVAFAKIANTVGQRNFFKYVRSFGFGSPTGIELPAEEKGRLKSVDKWSGRTLVTMAMGHEILTTPLQVTMAFATVANGGILLKPRIVKEWRDAKDGSLISSNEPIEVRRVISEETSAKVRVMLKSVVEKGTAKNIKSDWLEFAGKTGTAEVYDSKEGKYDRDRMVSSFMGMAPASQPALVCGVVMDEPGKHKYGAQAAAPVFKEIMEKIWFDPELYTYRRPLLNLNEPVVAKVKDTGEFDFKSDKIKSLNKSNVMPELEGMVLRDALAMLEESGVKIQINGIGKVKSQTPAAGSEINAKVVAQLELREDI
jgi:cell division protein FtsI/penicillin-binding protein 2